MATMKNMVTRIPGALVASCRKTPESAAWLDRLPEMVHELERRWNLMPDVPLQGEDPSCSYVAVASGCYDGMMRLALDPFRLLLIFLAGWLNQRQQDVIDYQCPVFQDNIRPN